MSNPIKTKQLYQHGNELQRLKKDLEASNEAYLKLLRDVEGNAGKLRESLSGLSGRNAGQRSDIATQAREAANLTSQYQKLQKAQRESAIELAKVEALTREANLQAKLQAQVLSTTSDSYDNLEIKLRLNEIQLKKLTLEQRNNTKEGRNLVAQNKKLVSQLDEFTKAERVRAKVAKIQAKEAKKHEAERVKAAKAAAKLNVEEQQLSIAKSESIKATKLQAKLANSVEGSYNSLSAQYALNKLQLNKLTAEERKNNKEAALLEKQTRDIFEEMKGLQAATGKTSLNVGNYSEAIRDAASGSFSFEAALSAIAANPVLGVITLLVGAVTALFKIFTRTERGARLMARVGGILEGVFSSLVGLVDNLAGGLVKAWQDPMGAMEDFVAFLKGQIVNRFLGLVGIVKGLGSAIEALWKRDMKALKEAAQDTFQSAVQSVTGLDKAMQDGLIDTVLKTADAFGDLRVAQRELELQEGRLTVALARTNVELQKQLEIADDDTRAWAERTAARQAAEEAILKASRTEIAIAKARMAILDQEIALRRANGEDLQELSKQRLEAQASLIEAEGNLTLALLENESRRRKQILDELERDLDILIDGIDNVKSVNERIIADESIAFSKRAALLAQTRELFDKSFEQQIATVQKLTDTTIDANDLMATSDAVTLNAKIRALGLGEIAEGRLLEIIRDRRTGIRDLIEAQQELTKELQVASLADDRFINSMGIGNDGIEERVKLFSSQSRLGVAAAKENAKELEEFMKKFKERIAPQEDEPKGLLEILGIDPKKGKEALKSAFSFIKDQFLGFAQARKELADQAVERADREVEAAQNNLDTQLALAEQGETANIELAQRQLEAEKQNQAKALEEQRKAQKAQATIQGIQQTGNLITMVSKVYSQLGFPIGLVAAGTMLGAFAAAKLRVASLTKKIFRRGGKINVGGGSHDYGNDTYIGTHGGEDAFAERGEKIGVFNTKAVRKHGPEIDQFIDMVNAGNLPSAAMSQMYSVSTSPTDMSGVENRLDKAYNKESMVVTPGGQLIIKKGNTTKYINGL